MPLTLPPESPSIDDLDNFDDEASAWVAWWEVGALELNALEVNVEARAAEAVSAATDIAGAAAVAIDAAGFAAISSSSASMVAGSYDFHLTKFNGGALAAGDKGFALNDDVVIVRRSDMNTRAYGAISAWDGVDDMTVDLVTENIMGTGGPYSDWVIVHAAFAGAGASPADILAGLTVYLSMTPKAFWDAAAKTDVVAYASTMNLDLQNASNFTTTITGAPTIGQPANMKVGQDITWTWTCGVGAGQPSFNATYWRRPNGTPLFLTTPGQVNIIVGRVMPGGYILWDLKRNPI